MTNNESTHVPGSAGGSEPLGTPTLFESVYAELRTLANQKLAFERPDHTLSATALVNEAYLRLIDSRESIGWESRAHFFAVAAEAMRRILIDSYRRKQAAKRGAGRDKAEYLEFDLPWFEHHEEMLAIDDVLDQFATDYPRQAQVFKLRCYGGVSNREIAEMLGISERTVGSDWAFAKAWLGQKVSS